MFPNEEALWAHVAQKTGAPVVPSRRIYLSDRPEYVDCRLVGAKRLTGEQRSLLADIIEEQRGFVAQVRETQEAMEKGPVIAQAHALREPTEPKEAVLSYWEDEAGQLLTREVARWLSDERQVKGFRETVLQDRTLSEEQAFAFVRSPATRVLNRAQFRQANIDPAAPLAEFHPQLETKRNRRVRRYAVRIEASGKVLGRAAAVHDEWPVPLGPEGFSSDDPLRLPDGRPGLLMGSICFSLAFIGRFFETQLPWDADEIARCVLTGDAPTVELAEVRLRFPGMGKHGNRTRIVIEADHWITPETIDRAYRHFQAQALGRESSPTFCKRLALVWFVDGRRKPGAKMNWPALLAEWNVAYPDHRFRAPSYLRRAYLDGRGVLG